MFLGGLPDDNHLYKHYKNFFNTTINTTINKNVNNSLYVVIHPIDIEKFNINDPKYDYLKVLGKNVSVVDKNNWIKTKWGTRSLSDATLLMMQYGFLHFGDIFKKYVLLSPNCCPLYNYNIIYNEFNKDNKSWVQANSDIYRGNNTNIPIKFYKFNGGQFDINTITNQSQWMAIDRNHMNLFFIIKKNILTKTYKTINNNDLKSFNKIFNSYLNVYKFKNYNYDSDNSFFIAIMSKIIHSKKDYINNFRVNNDWYYILNIVKHNWIKPLKINNINNIINDDTYFGENKKYKISFNKLSKINPKNIKEIYNIYTINNKKYILKNGKLLLKNIKSSNKNKIIIGKKKGISINLYSTPLTYVDWGRIIASPTNFLRGFNYFLNEKSLIFPNINIFLKMNTKEAIKNIKLFEKAIIILFIKYETSDFRIDNITMNPHYHPLEFTTYKIQEVLNVYNLYLIINKHNKIKDSIYLKAMKIWKKNLITYGAIRRKDGFYTIKNSKKIVGNKINPKILNNALSYGALFIRKVMSNSYIDKFSNELFNIKDYVPSIFSKNI